MGMRAGSTSTTHRNALDAALRKAAILERLDAGGDPYGAAGQALETTGPSPTVVTRLRRTRRAAGCVDPAIAGVRAARAGAARTLRPRAGGSGTDVLPCGHDTWSAYVPRARAGVSMPATGTRSGSGAAPRMK